MEEKKPVEDKKSKFDPKNIGQSVFGFLSKLRRHLKLIFIVTLSAIYIFVIFRINAISATAPSQEEIDTHLQEVTKPRIDKNAVKILTSLEERNIQVQTLFQEARTNPFVE